MAYSQDVYSRAANALERRREKANLQAQERIEEIGEKFDLTRERVRQIKEKAIRRLRHSSRSKLLKSYLG